MAGSKCRRGYAFRLKCSKCRNRCRQYRRLRVCRQRKLFISSRKTHFGKFKTKSVVRLLKHLACYRKVVKQIPSHANGLTSLAGKNECYPGHLIQILKSVPKIVT